MSSTNIISDAKAIYAQAPTSATVIKAIAAAGPIMDYPGMSEVSIVNAQEADNALVRILSVTDSGDGNKAGLTAIQHCLTGQSAPSTTLLTTIKAAYVAGPSVATAANAIAAGGPIMDYSGMLKAVQRYLEELFVRYTRMVQVTDSSDPNLTTINGILAVLV